MIWENWLIAISIGIVAIAFVALVVFVILALLSLRQMVVDLDHKVRSFDPLFRVVEKAGTAIEKRTSKVPQLADEVEEEVDTRKLRKRADVVNTAMEVAEWTLIGLALWQKIKERK